MKKIIISLITLILAVGVFAGCGNKTVETKDDAAQKKVSDNVNKDKFVEKDGLLTYTDTKNSPFENSGLKIVVKKGKEGYTKFIKTGSDGKETVEYYNFDFDKKMMEKYYYVSAMGTGFYYYYDLEKSELVKIEDKDHKDNTQKTKDSKRWDKSAEKVNEEVKALEKYFKEQYGKTIKEFVLER